MTTLVNSREQAAFLTKIVEVLKGKNFPQYGEALENTAEVQTETNGAFYRLCRLEDGRTLKYNGACSPSGIRYGEIHSPLTNAVERFELRFGAYWPGL